MNHTTRCIALLSLALGACAAQIDDASLAQSELKAAGGAVYTLSNEVAGNRVLAYRRSVDGSLSLAGAFDTGGRGSGGGLGSQGALVLDRVGRRLLAVNAGSNEISSFAVTGDGLVLEDVEPSNGARPVSLTIRGDLVYVVHADGGGNITGFHLGADGALHPIAGSTRPLSTTETTAPAQIEFSPDGTQLLVTEKATSRILTYALDRDGRAAEPHVHAASGMTPFGFAFDLHDHAIVSEAFGGTPGAGATSSYALDADGGLEVVSASEPNGQGAPCWVAIGNGGRYAYVTNTQSANLSVYAIDPDGALTLRSDGASASFPAGSRPTDMGTSLDGRYLYALLPGASSIAAFRTHADGTITSVEVEGAIAGTPVGIAAR